MRYFIQRRALEYVRLLISFYATGIHSIPTKRSFLTTILQRGPLNQESVKAAFICLVVEEKPPFTTVDAPAFRNFVELCNTEVIP